MTTMMMWMMLSDLSLRASSLHRGSGRFSPALALAVRAMYNVYNKQQTQNTSYLTDVLMWVRRNAIWSWWCSKQFCIVVRERYAAVHSSSKWRISPHPSLHHSTPPSGGVLGFFTQISSISVIIEEKILFSEEANFAMVLLPLRYRSLFHCGWFRGGIATLPPLCSLYLPKIKHLPIPFSSHWHIVWRKRPTPSTSEPENWL